MARTYVVFLWLGVGVRTNIFLSTLGVRARLCVYVYSICFPHDLTATSSLVCRAIVFMIMISGCVSAWVVCFYVFMCAYIYRNSYKRSVNKVRFYPVYGDC